MFLLDRGAFLQFVSDDKQSSCRRVVSVLSILSCVLITWRRASERRGRGCRFCWRWKGRCLGACLSVGAINLLPGKLGEETKRATAPAAATDTRSVAMET